MDYVTVRELREKSGEIWDRVEAGEEFIVTRNGKPFALLVHTEPQDVETRLRAVRLSRLGDLVQSIRASAASAQGPEISDDAIQAEIAAVRLARRPRPASRTGKSALAVQEPASKPYARRR